MSSGSESPGWAGALEGLESLRAAVRRAVAVAGAGDRTPVLLIDGPSGAGKSSLADALVARWPAPAHPRLIRMDDIYPGWHGLDAASSAIGRELLEPLRAGRPGRWRRWDWAGERFAEWHRVEGTAPVIIEGCGTLSASNVRLADLAVWLDADDALRKERALARDGATFEAHWDAWQQDFDRYVAREHPRAGAHLVLDVTGLPLSAAVRCTATRAR